MSEESKFVATTINVDDWADVRPAMVSNREEIVGMDNIADRLNSLTTALAERDAEIEAAFMEGYAKGAEQAIEVPGNINGDYYWDLSDAKSRLAAKESPHA